MFEKESLKSIFTENVWLINGIISIISVAIGVFLKIGYDRNTKKIQKMTCSQVTEEVQSILQVLIKNNKYNNVYYKEYKLKNTTNIDIKEFKTIFLFDDTATIIECSSLSKEGFNEQMIYIDSNNKNKAIAIVQNFNRKESITYKFTIGNVTHNSCTIVETGATGFKIEMKKKKKNKI